MRSLITPTDDFIRLDKVKLNADVAAGSTIVLGVYGNEGFSQNDYVCIGIEGSETCEIQQINAAVTPGNSIQVATLVYAHKQDEPVVKFRYNKRKFYGATSGSGSFSELVSSGSPKVIDVNNPQGTVLEYFGMEGYTYFKATYFNSQTSEETDITLETAVLADESKRFCTLYQIRFQAGFVDNGFMTDGLLEEYRKQAENEVRSYIMFRYTLPLSEIPNLITRCTYLLAAAYMDYREYGKDGEGVKWLGEARGILNSIQKGNQRLLGANEQELATNVNSNSVLSYPNTTDNVNGPTRHFTMDQKF